MCSVHTFARRMCAIANGESSCEPVARRSCRAATELFAGTSESIRSRTSDALAGGQLKLTKHPQSDPEGVQSLEFVFDEQFEVLRETPSCVPAASGERSGVTEFRTKCCCSYE